MRQAKLSAEQQAQIAFLESLPPRFERLHRLIEELASVGHQDVAARSLARMLDEMRHQAAAVSLVPLADTAGLMGQLIRRGVGPQVKLRGLREGLVSLRINAEGALRVARRPGGMVGGG